MWNNADMLKKQAQKLQDAWNIPSREVSARQVNDLNDHLAELVDTLDDMDGSVQSDVDEKDPVLMRKRTREKLGPQRELPEDRCSFEQWVWPFLRDWRRYVRGNRF
eukprot:Skav227156  [mRNA]  locus=scaffold502:72523:74674:- [translate_table: standard]